MTKPPKSRPLLHEPGASIRSRPRRKRNPDQPQFSFEPMPERVEPALAQLMTKPPRGSDWSWEIKWDGYRLAVHIEPQRIRVLTRNGHDWTHRFPAIEEAAKALGPATMILDGEAVMLDDQGRSDFGLLQKSLGATAKTTGKRASNAILYAFDLLYLDGHDLRDMEQRSRRHWLGDVLRGHDGAIRLSETFDEDPAVLLEHACQLGLKGIIGKLQDRPYRSGRTGDWVKVKCVQSEAFFIVGYEVSSTSSNVFSTLALAA
ncbi:ATP-dependent DNA ligase, partial [Agrobacterium sp.]|uniref:ATP-dependent DNA ligase n=1 Tax=Agrobacterium sp. TaxID=361 RepID=UPI0028AB5644